MPIEPATLADLDTLVDHWVALAAEQQIHGAHLTAEPNRELMRAALARHVVDHQCLVAREAGSAADAIVGFVSFDIERDGLDRSVCRGVVQNLYIVPESRDRGHGTKLLRAAEDALMAVGAERVVLEAMAGNERARQFYEDRGYSPHRLAYERRTESDTKEGS